MISKKYIAHIINKSEIDYLDCWDTLSHMKGEGSITGFNERILNFQSNLAFSILRLEKLYREIHQEKLSIISRKKNLSEIWLSKRLKLLKEYKVSVNYAISIGKSIGDAFAWIFYKDETELLEEHYNHKNEFHMPVGIGGHGELEFIKNIRSLEGNMALYHGITTFLNLGDVSLIDLENMKVSAIGEIKTKKIDDNLLNITIYFIGDKKSNPFKKAKITRTISKKDESLPTKMHDRLRRQMRRMEQSFIDTENYQFKESIQTEMTGHYSDFRSFTKKLNCKKVIYQKFGDGLLLAGIKIRNKSLASNLLDSSKVNYGEKFQQLGTEALKIIDKNLEYNSIIYGTFFYRNKYKSHLMIGMTPLFWWPIDIDSIKNIIFQNVIISTVYNPAHLQRKLANKGYLIDHSDDGKKVEVKKVLPDHHVVVEGLHYFISMITQYLIEEEVIVDTIERSYTTIMQSNPNVNTKAALKFKHRIT